MPESLFKSLADCLADRFDSKTILGIGLFGEDTMHPDFADFLKYAAGRGLKINLSTNFVLVNQNISPEIIESVSLLEISFYTLNKEQYNSAVGRNQYDQVLKNIHSFLTLAEKSHFPGQIRLRPFKDFAGQADHYNKEFYQKYPSLNFERSSPKIMINWAGSLKLPKLLRGLYMSAPCSFPFSRLAVDWDGEVRLCCSSMMAEDLKVGQAGRDCDLYDLWNGKKLNRIREKFAKIDYRDFPSCRSCYLSRRYFPLRKD